jgi:hypothetical protein
LTAVNGTAVTFIRSDGAPALDQSIAPTWTGVHTFANSIALGTPTNQGTAGQVLMSAGTGATPTWGTPVAGFTIDEAYFFAGF